MNDRLNNEPMVYFRASQFLNDFSETEIKTLFAEGQKVKFRKNAILFEQGQPGELLYFIEQGQVKLTRADPSGKELTLAILGPKEFFGEMALMDDLGRSANAYAVTDLELLAISRSSFHDLLLKYPYLALRVIKTLCLRLRNVDQKMEEMAFGSTKERLKNLLLNNSIEKKIFLKQTHQELADKVCASRETVTRILKSLKEEGWAIEKMPKK